MMTTIHYLDFIGTPRSVEIDLGKIHSCRIAGSAGMILRGPTRSNGEDPNTMTWTRFEDLTPPPPDDPLYWHREYDIQFMNFLAICKAWEIFKVGGTIGVIDLQLTTEETEIRKNKALESTLAAERLDPSVIACAEAVFSTTEGQD